MAASGSGAWCVPQQLAVMLCKLASSQSRHVTSPSTRLLTAHWVAPAGRRFGATPSAQTLPTGATCPLHWCQRQEGLTPMAAGLAAAQVGSAPYVRCHTPPQPLLHVMQPFTHPPIHLSIFPIHVCIHTKLRQQPDSVTQGKGRVLAVPCLALQSVLRACPPSCTPACACGQTTRRGRRRRPIKTWVCCG